MGGAEEGRAPEPPTPVATRAAGLLRIAEGALAGFLWEKVPRQTNNHKRTLPPPQKWILTYFHQEGLNQRLGLRRTAFPPPEQVAEGLTRVTPPREGLVTP